MHTITGSLGGLLRCVCGILLLGLAQGAIAQQVDYCNLQFPSTFSAASGTTSPVIYGRIYEDDNGVLTSSPGAHPAIVGQLGYGPLGSDPRGENPDWRWIAALYNVQVGNDDEYQGSFTVPFAPTGTQLAYTYRFSVDSGADFTYCDTNGNGTNAGLSFSTAALGTLTISSGALPTISINDVSLSEGNSGTTAFAFTISLSGPSLASVTFDIATADGTATAASGDYTSQSLTGLSIPAGDTSATFTVQVNGDTTEEPNETFFVNLTNVTGATVTDAQGLGTIINDDDACAAIAFPYTLGSNAPAELILAIRCANLNGAGSDTIDLDGRTIVLTATHANVGGANIGLPEVTTAIVIQNGTITRSSADQFRHFANTGDLTLNDMTLSNGNAPVDGGSIVNSGTATLTLNRSRLIGNTGNFGGALFVGAGTTAVINNSLLSGNRATAPGGAIRTRGTLQLNNSTLAGNFTTAGSEGGGGIALAGAGSIVLNNAIVAGNEASNFPATNDIAGAFTSNNSLVGVSPGFIAPLDASANAPTTTGDYRLAPFSVAIDAGDNSLVTAGTTTDLDGVPRRVDDANVADTGAGTAPIVDIGAYERQTDSQLLADLAITKTDGQTSALAGSTLTYTITASNAGPDNAAAVTIADTFPALLSGITWTCVGAGGGSCTAAGSGNISDSVSLPAGGSVTYTASASIDAAASGTLSNTATISAGGGVSDSSPGNNSATDTTAVSALPQLNVQDFSAAEGNTGNTAFSITVSLSAPAPAGGVSFDIATADASASAPSDYIARSLSSQVIPAGSTSYAFEVSVLGDARVESNETFRVSVSNVTGALVADAEGLVTIVNDDAAGVVVAPTSLDLAEGGGSGSYTLVLTSEPAAPVTISVNGDAQATATPAALVFSAANWNVPQAVTVAAVDDSAIEGPHAGTVTHTANGGEYTGLGIANVQVNIADNDSAGILVSESGGATTVTEGGAGDTLSLVLTAQPGADVTIALSGGAQLSTAPTSLVFTSANWNVAQTVAVSAVDDSAVEGDHSGTVAFSVSSADAAFNGIALPSVTVSIADNDFTVGGNVSGLAGAGLVLQNNGADDLAISSNGGFAFSTALSNGSPYAVTVLSQPAGQFCAVSNGTGTLAGANVTGITVTCSALSLVLSTTTLDLGNLIAGSGSGLLTLSNPGPGDVVVTAISTPAAPFSITGGSCPALPRTLAPGASCTFELRFAPNQLGTFTDTLVISSTAQGSPQQVTLRGALVRAVQSIPVDAPWSLLLLALAVLGIGGWRFATGRSAAE